MAQVRDGSVNFYELVDGVQLKHVRVIRTGHKGFCRGDACDNHFALPYGDAGIKLYNLASGDEIGEALNNLKAGSNVTAIKFASAAGERILAAYEDGEISLWNTKGEKLGVMR